MLRLSGTALPKAGGAVVDTRTLSELAALDLGICVAVNSVSRLYAVSGIRRGSREFRATRILWRRFTTDFVSLLPIVFGYTVDDNDAERF